MGDLYLKADDSVWVRPADWLPIDHLVNVGDQRVAMLYAVQNDSENFHSLTVGTVAYTVDWGDGTVINYAANAVANHQYTYATLPASTTTSEGFRQAIIQVYPQSGNFTGSINLQIPISSLTYGNYKSRVIDLRIATSTATLVTINGAIPFRSLKKLVYLGTHQNFSFSQFLLASAVRYIEVDLSNFTTLSNFISYSTAGPGNYLGNITNNIATNVGFMFERTNFIKKLGNVTFNAATTITSLFSDAHELKEIGNFTANSATSAVNVFANTFSLISIGTVSLPVATDLNSCFINTRANIINVTTGNALLNLQNCFRACCYTEEITVSDCSSVNNTTTMLLLCYNLKRLVLTGIKVGFTVPPCRMKEQAFVALFNSLGTASGSQTIVITGNITLLPSTIAIATGKGFTVTP